jgi:hypothetical protein
LFAADEEVGRDLTSVDWAATPQESYHTFSYSPLRDDVGAVVGMLCVVSEDTERVIGERRMATLRDLGSDLSVVRTEQETLEFAARQLDGNWRDLPFTLTYLFGDDDHRGDGDGHGATARPGVAPGHAAAAAGEAAANAVEHATAGRPANAATVQITLTAPATHTMVQLTVTDTGSWRSPPSDREPPTPDTRGHGIIFMHALMDDVTIVPSEHGTTVTLTKDLKP